MASESQSGGDGPKGPAGEDATAAPEPEAKEDSLPPMRKPAHSRPPMVDDPFAHWAAPTHDVGADPTPPVINFPAPQAPRPQPAVVISRVVSIGASGPTPTRTSAASALRNISAPEQSGADDLDLTPHVPDVTGLFVTPRVPPVASRAGFGPIPTPNSELPPSAGTRMFVDPRILPAVAPNAPEPEPSPTGTERPPDTRADGTWSKHDAATDPDASADEAPVPSSPKSLSPQAGSVPPPTSVMPSAPPPSTDIARTIQDGSLKDVAALLSRTDDAKTAWQNDTVESLLADVDAGFGAILDDRIRADSDMPSPAFDLGEARALFLEMAKSHMRHVRDFVLDLTAGPATSDWVGLCIPAARSLCTGASQFELQELENALSDFVQALEGALRTGEPTVDGAARDEILGAYELLAREMPGAFTVEGRRHEREGIIVKSLLEQVEGVQKVQEDKLFAAGLMALDVLSTARPRDVADTTGLPFGLATSICERFRRYRDEVSTLAVDDARSEELRRLDAATMELALHHEAYEAAAGTGQAKRKKEARKQRELAWLDVKIVVARLGEIEALARAERTSFQGRLQVLRDLAQSRKEHRPEQSAQRTSGIAPKE
jgi:hypothetical protein